MFMGKNTYAGPEEQFEMDVLDANISSNLSEGTTCEMSLSPSGAVTPILVVTLVACISLATVLGNVAIILCIVKNRCMLTVYNIYAASLAVADLMVGTVVMTSMSVYTYHGHWPLGNEFCTIWVLFDFTCCTISMLHLDAIAFDRFKSVTSPLLYRTTFTKSRAVKISVFMWVLGAVLWLPSILSFRIHDEIHGLTVENDCYFVPDKYFIAGQVSAAYYIPVLFMVVMYILLICSLNKRTGTSKSTSVAISKSTVYIVSGLEGIYRTRTGSVSLDMRELPRQAETSFVRREESLKRHGKNVASSKISAQNRRCIRTLGVIIVVFLCCWLPFVVFWPLAAFCETCVSANVYEISYWLAYVNSFVNPFIYFLLNRDFRRAFLKIFCGQKRRGIRDLTAMFSSVYKEET